ncbi:MAG: hypothetical protein KGH95_07865 [Thaumarchaeota archaeon]|nr:hypothetical protein [Nitrososphaerota archaeon]
MSPSHGSDNRRWNGRPTKRDQVKIQNDVKKYYRRGLTIEDICHLTKYNRKTVFKYFSVWDDVIKQDQAKDIISREKEARSRSMKCYMDLLCSEYQNFDMIEEKIKSTTNMQVYVQLLSRRSESSRNIAAFREKIDSLEMIPTIKETVKNMMEANKK